MSRTYRRVNANYLIRDKLIVTDYTYRNGRSLITTIFHSRKSDEGKRIVARFCSDTADGFDNWRGPSWFHTMHTQTSYRARCRNAIQRSMLDPDYEVVLEANPRREYWD